MCVHRTVIHTFKTDWLFGYNAMCTEFGIVKGLITALVKMFSPPVPHEHACIELCVYIQLCIIIRLKNAP